MPDSEFSADRCEGICLRRVDVLHQRELQRDRGGSLERIQGCARCDGRDRSGRQGIRSRYDGAFQGHARDVRSEEHTSELQSLMRNSYAVFCLKKHTDTKDTTINAYTK